MVPSQIERNNRIFFHKLVVEFWLQHLEVNSSPGAFKGPGGLLINRFWPLRSCWLRWPCGVGRCGCWAGHARSPSSPYTWCSQTGGSPTAPTSCLQQVRGTDGITYPHYSWKTHGGVLETIHISSLRVFQTRCMRAVRTFKDRQTTIWWRGLPSQVLWTSSDPSLQFLVLSHIR